MELNLAGILRNASLRVSIYVKGMDYSNVLLKSEL